MTSTLNQISIGDIVKPASENGYVYVYDIGHDLDGSVKNYLTYRVVDVEEAISGTNALPLTKKGILSGNLSKLGFKNPVVEIRNNRLRTILVDDDTYYVQDIACKTSSNFQNTAENIHNDIGANNEKYGASRATIRITPYGNYTGGPVVGEGREKADDGTTNSGLTTRVKKASSLVNIRDIYLDHATALGLISEETLQSLGNNYTTLQQALYALKKGDLRTGNTKDAASVKPRTFSKSFPQAAAYVKSADRIHPQSAPREEAIVSDAIVEFAEKEKITLAQAVQQGWISQRSADLLHDQYEDSRSCTYLEEAFRLVGAHQHFISEYVDNETGQDISAQDIKLIIADTKNAYNQLSKEIHTQTSHQALGDIVEDLKTGRSAFFERGDIAPSTFVHHDFSRAVITRLQPEVDKQKRAIENRDYAALKITPPS